LARAEPPSSIGIDSAALADPCASVGWRDKWGQLLNKKCLRGIILRLLFVHTILATIISDSQTRAKKKRTMDLFFVRYRATSQKKTAKTGSEKKEARPARNVRRKLVSILLEFEYQAYVNMSTGDPHRMKPSRRRSVVILCGITGWGNTSNEQDQNFARRGRSNQDGTFGQ
jgi:hypothetical protein